MLQPSKKTPTQYSGLKPDDHNFEERFYGWNKSEQIEYLEYFERDTTKYALSMGFVSGLIVGAIIVLVILVFMR